MTTRASKSLGEHGQSQQSVDGVPAPARVGTVQGGDQAVECGGDQEAENRLRDEHAGEEKISNRGGGEQSRVESGTRAEGAAAPDHAEQNEQTHGGDGGQAGGKFIDAEDAIASGNQPVHQGRFFQVAHAVDVQGDVVAAGEHLASSLGVRGVHVVLQRRREGRAKIDG